MARGLASYQAEILEAKKRALIDYGDPELAARVLGEGANENSVIGPTWGIDTSAGEQALATLAQYNRPFDNQLASPFASRIQQGIREAQGKAFTSPFDAHKFRMGYADVGVNYFKPFQTSGGSKGIGATTKAARDNPYSTLAMMKLNRENDFRGLRENMNKANLWYSSERGRREGLLGTEYGRKEQEAAVKVQDYLKDLDKKLASYKEGLAQQELDAAKQAASKKFSTMMGGA